MGLVGLYGKDMAELLSRLDKVNSTLRAKNAAGENMFIVFDDSASVLGEYEAGLRDFES